MSMNKSYNTISETFKKSALQDLNLMNSFLFSELTEKQEDAEFIAKLIIERATGTKVEKVSVMPEKTVLGIDIGNHGIRMDLYVESYEEDRLAKVYDIEPNNYKTSELPMRSRYSQALTDVKLLEAGRNYQNLPDYISIWILPYDPFGDNRMLYTVKNCVVENNHLVYNDGVMKLYLYTGGDNDGNRALADLLHYFSKSNEENVVDAELLQLHNIVENTKRNRRVEEKYMTLHDYLECEIEAGIEAGIEARVEELVEARVGEIVEARVEETLEARVEEFKKEDMQLLIETLSELGIPQETIVDKLVEKYHLSVSEAQSIFM